MSERTRSVIALAIVVIGWVGRVSAGEPDWRGSWLADDGTWRHVGAQGTGLVLEGRVRGLEVTLRGHGDAGGVVLRGTALDPAGNERPARLVGRPVAGRAASAASLAVTFDVEGLPPAEELWRRPGAPSLRLAVPGDRRAASTIRLAPGAPLRVEVHVGGRPQGVVLTIVAPDDPRYAHLGGVVHHHELGVGARLPVGRHDVTWSGRDRSPDAAPLLPGRYRVIVSAVEGLLGPAPGEEGVPVVAELALVVGEDPTEVAPVTATLPSAPVPPAALEATQAPRPGLTSGLASRP